MKPILRCAGKLANFNPGKPGELGIYMNQGSHSTMEIRHHFTPGVWLAAATLFWPQTRLRLGLARFISRAALASSSSSKWIRRSVITLKASIEDPSKRELGSIKSMTGGLRLGIAAILHSPCHDLFCVLQLKHAADCGNTGRLTGDSRRVFVGLILACPACSRRPHHCHYHAPP